MNPETRHLTQLQLSRMWVDENGLFCVEYNPGGNVVMEDAQELLLALESFREKIGLDPATPHYVLVDNRGVKSMSPEARSFFASSNEVANTGAVAIVINSRVAEVRGNFFIYVGGPKYPTRLFTSREEAVKWLLRKRSQQSRE